MQTKCQGLDCRTRVEVDAGDLAFVPDARDGDAVKWRCPTCGRENFLSASVVPERARSRLR